MGNSLDGLCHSVLQPPLGQENIPFYNRILQQLDTDTRHISSNAEPKPQCLDALHSRSAHSGDNLTVRNNEEELISKARKSKKV